MVRPQTSTTSRADKCDTITSESASLAAGDDVGCSLADQGRQSNRDGDAWLHCHWRDMHVKCQDQTHTIKESIALLSRWACCADVVGAKGGTAQCSCQLTTQLATSTAGWATDRQVRDTGTVSCDVT
eukprot:m.423043 g.423043  ORF g.423043 m.423043 type:complete len:127 (+) comp39663_c0_seq1:2-382(+)